MGEDQLAQVGEIKLGLQDGGGAPDHLGGVAADHVDAQHLPGAGIEDQLGEAGGLETVLGDEPPGHVAGDAGGDDLASLLLRSGLRQSDARALGGGVDGPRNGVPAHHLAAPVGLRVDDVGGSHLPHAVGGVRQQAAAGDVADGPDVRQVGAHPVVDDHAAAGVLQPALLSTPALDGGLAADGHQHVVGLHRLLGAVGGGPADLAAVDRGDAAAECEGDLFQGLAELRSHLVVGEGHDLRQHLDHGDLGAQHRVEAGELHADHPATDHGQAFRHLGQ